jgi:hypothetical protein
MSKIMANTTDRLRRAGLVLAACAALLGSCKSIDDPMELTIQFEKEDQYGHSCFVRTYDLATLSYKQVWSDVEGFDLELSYDTELRLSNNGTRNLIHVGDGDEAAFRRLVSAMDRWAVRDLADAMSAARVVPFEGGSYWTPVPFDGTPGMIIATRNVRNAGDDGDIGALIYFKSFGDDDIVLLIAREPTRGYL